MKRFPVYHGRVPLCQSYHDDFRPDPVQVAELDPHRRHRWIKPNVLVSSKLQRRKS